MAKNSLGRVSEIPINTWNNTKVSKGVALLPFIDEQRLLDAVEKVYPKLTAEDHARNALGKDVLYMSDEHPLYNDLVTKFYSKRGDTEVIFMSQQIALRYPDANSGTGIQTEK